MMRAVGPLLGVGLNAARRATYRPPWAPWTSSTNAFTKRHLRARRSVGIEIWLSALALKSPLGTVEGRLPVRGAERARDELRCPTRAPWEIASVCVVWGGRSPLAALAKKWGHSPRLSRLQVIRRPRTSRHRRLDHNDSEAQVTLGCPQGPVLEGKEPLACRARDSRTDLVYAL